MEEVREIVVVISSGGLLMVLLRLVVLLLSSLLALYYLCYLNGLRLDASVVHFRCGLFATAQRLLLLLVVAEGLLKLTD